MSTEHTQLIRGLGLIAAISVNVGNIIGTGVFLKTRVMTCNVGSPARVLIVWVVAGLLAMAGALTYAELLAMKPRAAGEYGLVRDAYGRPLGFIYGWTQFLIARTASAAALAAGLAIFLNDLSRRSPGSALSSPSSCGDWLSTGGASGDPCWSASSLLRWAAPRRCRRPATRAPYRLHYS
jgi:amino acid transporter